MQYYHIQIGSLDRGLPVIPVSDKIAIASFVMLGDTELIEAAAEGLVNHEKFPRGEIDLLVCPEAKAIPLTHAMARMLGIRYVVIRKQLKTYMYNPLVETVSSITTEGEQQLVLDGIDRELLAGKRVCIIDDVVSTGGSFASMRKLLAKTDCTIIAEAAVLLEAGGYSGENLIYLEKLPVWKITGMTP
jgi:adenine phosphoribosyltransferase